MEVEPVAFSSLVQALFSRRSVPLPWMIYLAILVAIHEPEEDLVLTSPSEAHSIFRLIPDKHQRK